MSTSTLHDLFYLRGAKCFGGFAISFSCRLNYLKKDLCFKNSPGLLKKWLLFMGWFSFNCKSP